MSARVALAAALLLALPVARAADAPPSARPAAGIDLFFSDDADDTQVRRLGVSVDWRFVDARHYRGIELERNTISPLGGPARDFDRAFVRFADTRADWEWNGRVGSDGHRLLGSASVVHAGRHRTEFFAERDLLESRRGIATGQVVTFAGAAVDLPLDAGQRQQLTLLGGLQDFDDGNLRTHLRATYVATLSERLGLSGQLRARAFRNSEPQAGDYFSPRNFVELVPTLQVRRRFADGWTGTIAAGWGEQRHTGSDWRQARLVQASVASPARPGHGYLRASFGYSDTPGISGEGYGYRQATLQWVLPL